jgi:hypothetical protein
MQHSGSPDDCSSDVPFWNERLQDRRLQRDHIPVASFEIGTRCGFKTRGFRGSTPRRDTIKQVVSVNSAPPPFDQGRNAEGGGLTNHGHVAKRKRSWP